jgi:hypothetical protein
MNQTEGDTFTFQACRSGRIQKVDRQTVRHQYRKEYAPVIGHQTIRPGLAVRRIPVHRRDLLRMALGAAENQ